MLFSQQEERSRQFSLALRAGLPILFLIALIFYALVEENTSITISIKLASLVAAITFISVYFIFFLINLGVKESLLEESSQRFNQHAFIRQIQHTKIHTLGLLRINNLQELAENYSHEQIDNLLYTLTHKLHLACKQHGFKKVPIGKYYNSEFLIGIEDDNGVLKMILEKMILENQQVDSMAIDYSFAILTNTDTDFEKAIVQLHDIIRRESYSTPEKLPSQTNNTKELSDIEQNIIKSIQEKRIILSFKPLLNTQTKDIEIYEISVKLKSGTQEILPRVFLPIINRLGLGREYDFILISHIINSLKLIDKKIAFSFNVSPFSLRDSTFQTKVFQYIKEKDIDASRLIIQLYERKTHHDLSAYLETLKAFKRRGLRICIDNFGSSSASMEYMKHFKFDMVQFDRDYVTKLNDATTTAMFSSLITLSKELNIITIAKWVDNEKQKNTLTTLGIDYLQGFGIGKPITEQQLLTTYN